MHEGRIEDLKYIFRGMKAAILVEDRDVVISEFDRMKTKELSDLIYYLLAACKERSDFKRVIIETKNEKFYVFYHNDLFLGVLCEAEINFPLLKRLVKKAFKVLVAKKEGNEAKGTDDIDERARKFF